MTAKQIVRSLLPPILADALRRLRHGNSEDGEQEALETYARGGRVPWTPGYDIYKQQFVLEALRNDALRECFRGGEALPQGYGVGVDERCIEYPWLLARIPDRPEVLLDAGSTLNHDFILEHPVLRRKVIHILTLAPERECFWERGISYLFHDLRDIPVRDGYYDTIACLSTLEHVGCDNMLFTRNMTSREDRPEDFVSGVRELRRVLKTGGGLFLTVPFGVHRHFGTFQQFDGKLLSRAVEAFGETGVVVETFYRYTAEGWNVSSAEDCAQCEYVAWIVKPRHEWPIPLPVEPDRAAAARGVACVQLVKG